MMNLDIMRQLVAEAEMGARDMHALSSADPELDPDWMVALRAKFETWFAEMRELFAETF